MIGNGTFDLQLRLFAVFNFIFVAPGCINQMQPFFLHNRDIFETREKKASEKNTREVYLPARRGEDALGSVLPC